MKKYEASEILIKAIKIFEGYRSAAYKDAKGVWTIGYGHTGDSKRGYVRQGQKCTEAKAEEWLRKDIAIATAYVNKQGCCKTQGQFDALVDFAYNLGTGNLGRSTLLKKVKHGAPVAQVQAEFRKWVYSGGKILQGLVRRRNWEAIRYADED